MAVLLTYLPLLFLFFYMFLPTYQEEHLHYQSKFKRLCIFIGSMNRLLSYIRSMMPLAPLPSLLLLFHKYTAYGARTIVLSMKT